MQIVCNADTTAAHPNKIFDFTLPTSIKVVSMYRYEQLSYPDLKTIVVDVGHVK